MPRYGYGEQKRKSLSQNWGSSFLRTKVSREPYLLDKRTLKDLKYWEWFFIILSMIGILINIGFNLYQLITAIMDKEKFLFPIIVCITNLFAVFFLFLGILKELPFQILMQLITKFVIWIFNLVYFLSPKDKGEFDVTEEEVKDIRFYISSSMLVLIVPVGFFVFYQYWNSNMSLFKTVGTEPKYVNMCRTLFLGQSLISLDVEISLIALLLSVSKGFSEIDLFAIVILPTGFFFVIIWACIGYFVLRTESRWMTFTFYFLSHLQPLYVIYLIIRSPKWTVRPLLFFTTISVAVIFFVIHVSLLVTVVHIQKNYDKGLKQAAEKEIARTKSIAQSLNVSSEYIDRADQRRRQGPIHTDI